MSEISKPGFPGSIQDTNQISGPVSITYHPNLMNKDLYIFGDIHLEDTGLCQMILESKPIEIVDFFDNVFQKTNVPIDFFLEIPVINLNKIIASPPLTLPASHPELSGPMVRLRDRFKDCFDNYLLNDCGMNYPMIEFHSMDIRQKTNSARNNGKLTFFTQYSSVLKSIVSECESNIIEKLITSNQEDINENGRDTLLNKIGNLILLFNNNELIKIMKDYIRIPHRDIKFNSNDHFEYYEKYEYPGVNEIRERINRLPYDLRGKLMSLFNDRSLMIIKSYKEIQEEIQQNWTKILSFINDKTNLNSNTNNINDLDSKISKDELTNKENLKKLDTYTKLCNLIKFKALQMFNIDGLFFDISNLAKILGILSEKPNNNNNNNTNNNEEIWIYMGEGHAEVFRKFIIEKLNYPIFIHSTSITQRCQNVEKIKHEARKNKPNPKSK